MAESNGIKKRRRVDAWVLGIEGRLRDMPEYTAWTNMKTRCTNPKSSHYADYGGRGIAICDRWLNSFGAFLDDMGQRPSSRHSVDRIDLNRGYCPENCRWAIVEQQVRNRRMTRFYTHDGKTMCLQDWADETGMRYMTLVSRVNRGWPFERAIDTTPLPYGPKHRPR